MKNSPEKNRNVSIFLLSVLGMSSLVLLILNIENWFSNNLAIKKLISNCNVLKEECANAYYSIISIAANPYHIVLSFGILALIFVFIKSLLILLSARQQAKKFSLSPNSFPKLQEIINQLISIDKKIDDIKFNITNEKEMIAFTYGLFKPTICLSEGLINNLSNKELMAVIAHELGHIKKRDNLAIFIAIFVRDLLWFLPISHFLFAWFKNEKEFAADDFAARTIGNPIDLAEAILSVAKASNKCLVKSPAYATFFYDQANIKTRVKRLVLNDFHLSFTIKNFFAASIASLIILAMLGGVVLAQPKAFIGEKSTCSMGVSCAKYDFKCCKSD